VLVSLFERRPNIMFVGTARHGVFRTENGGQSWRRADNGLPVSGQTGAPVQLREIRINPDNSDEAIAVHEAFGPFRTIDGGERWAPLAGGLPVTSSRPLSSYAPILIHGPGNALFLVFSQPVHSHLVKTRLYRLEGDTWVPLEPELPDNSPIIGATWDEPMRALTLWTDESSVMVAAERLRQ
jgi:hypothetical protein